MQRKTVIAVIAAIVLTLTFTVAGGSAWARMENGAPASFTQLVKEAGPAVVNIATKREASTSSRNLLPERFQERFPDRRDPFQEFFDRFFGGEPPVRESRPRSLGSGFIISADGFIVTNHHVVRNADQILVRLSDGREFTARIIGADQKTDLALLKIDLPNAERLPVLPLGDSTALEVGQWVVAIGSPFGFDHTVTAGIVSAKGRSIGAGPYDDFIQTDASINPGNSGGPLLNMKGEVVGINTAIIAHAQGIGFAIPADLARGIIDQLKASGSVTRGWLGVQIQDVTDDIKEYYSLPSTKGALVARVFEGDPADRAGIKQGDVIVEVDGKQVADSRDLTRMVADIPVDKKTPIVVIRDGKRARVSVTIARRDDDVVESPSAPAQEFSRLGWTLAPLDSETASRLGIADEKGVVVTGVEPGGKADSAGLSPGDVIREINRKTVTSVSDVEKLVDAAKQGDILNLFVQRRASFIVLKLEK
jgi:serine protease Do